MKKIACPLSLIILFSLFIQSVLACGPFTVDPLFSFNRHADYPLQDYAKGKIGIVPKSYGRMSLFVFYRELNNLPLSANEQAQFLEALTNRIGTHPKDDESETVTEPVIDKNSGEEQWKTSRAKVLAGDPKIEMEKHHPDEYFYYTSCLEDAFRNASKTLEARIAKYGINDDVKEWLNGQDAVFSNCGGVGKTPQSLSDNSTEWLRKDRQYQTAATLFYLEKFADARKEFGKIAKDDNSVWKNTAKFVMARTYIREAGFIDETSADYEAPPKTIDNANSNSNTISGHPYGNAANAPANYPPLKEVKSADEKKNEKAELYQKAEEKLKDILADNSMKDFHASALRLLNFVEFRAKPREQRRELAKTLVQKGENANLYNDLVDYIWLLDTVENEASEAGRERENKEAVTAGKEYDYEYNLKRRDISNDELGADLTDWLFTYQTVDGFEHSYAKWKETKRLSWLVAAIAQATKDSPNLTEVLSEADQIKADSPAFATVRTHQIQLLIETGKPSQAKQKLDEILGNLKQYTRSTQNDFLSQRMQLAENLEDFLKYAQRQAATFVWSDDSNEEGDDLKDSKELKIWQNRTMFDFDSMVIFNEKIPLSVLRQAALSPNLPNHLKKFLVIAVWTRAFILGNQAIQQEFTPLMIKFAPEYKVSATTSEAMSLLTIGRNPALQPYVPIGYGRENSDTKSIDSIRGNWWCVEDTKTQSNSNFLTEAQKATALAEQKKLASSGESATFLARRAVEFANKNMTNPNTPEILHLAVRSTRYGCKDAQTLKFSKAAFDILHKSFPGNVWTKKTPYFFGEPEN